MIDIKRTAINNDIRYQYKDYCCDDSCLVIDEMPHPDAPSNVMTYQVNCANCGWFTMHTQEKPMNAPNNDELAVAFLECLKGVVRKGDTIYVHLAYDVYWLERFGLIRRGKATSHNIKNYVQPYWITALGRELLTS